MLKSNQNDGTQLGWHGIGTWSTTQINVTWNTYEGRSAVNAVGYIAVCKVQEQWGAINASNNVTYPISFTKIAHPIISINYTSTNIDAAYWPIKSSTLTGFTRVLTALSGHYLAGGY